MQSHSGFFKTIANSLVIFDINIPYANLKKKLAYIYFVVEKNSIYLFMHFYFTSSLKSFFHMYILSIALIDLLSKNILKIFASTSRSSVPNT